MKRSNGWAAFAIGALAALQVGLAMAAPEVGWWWNPDESGRGFFIESQGGILYMAAYVYADDGRARWLVAGGPNADPYHFSGRLSEYHGGQTLLGPYVAPAAPVDAGAISIDFADDRHGTISWPGGTVSIQREIFDTGQAVFQPQSGWWWNPAESGSGYSIEVQGGNLFLVGFMYDGAGNPVWYFSAGPMKTPAAYSGSLLRFADGQTVTGPYRPPTPPTTIGTLAVSFAAEDAATLTFTGNGSVTSGSGPNAKASRSIDITREFHPSMRPYDVPTVYTGSFAQSLEIHDTVLVESVDVTVLAIGTGLTWNTTGQHPSSPVMLGQLTRFLPSGGSVTVAVNYSSSSPAASCSGNAANTFPFRDLLSNLLVSDSAQYAIQIGMAGDDLQVTLPITCTTPVGSFQAAPVVYGMPVKLISGVEIAGNVSLTGSVGPTQETAVLKRTGSWQLFARPNGF